MSKRYWHRTYDYYDHYRPSRPRKVEGGLKVEARRGEIGGKWWSKRFISVLDSFGWSNRMERGRRYARSGQVINVSIEAGRVTAKVQGSMAYPYDVDIKYPVSTETSWAQIIEKMKGNPELVSRILVGEVPAELEKVFDDEHSPLFPKSGKEIGMDCSCPDYATPCKHIAAVFYVLADNFDRDPFLLLQLKGKGRSEILRALSSEVRKDRGRAEKKSSGKETSVEDLLGFWSYRPLNALPEQVDGHPVSPLSKYPLPSEFDDPLINHILSRYYDEIAIGMRSIGRKKK